MRTWIGLGAFGLLLFATGCGGPAPTPVEGTVVFGNNKKAENLLLQFHSIGGKSEEKRPGGSAVTDSNGHYNVTGDNGAAGIPPGDYIVTVIDNNLNTEDEPGKGKPVPPNRVPLKYLGVNDKTNPLKVTVQTGKTGYDLKLD